MGRRCLGCGKRKSKRNYKAVSSFPRLFNGVSAHIDEGCFHQFFIGAGAEVLPFEQFVNVEETLETWWVKKARAFVVYVSESGHRQWPAGGKWDLEIMACALSGVFETLIPILVYMLRNGNIEVRPISNNQDQDIIPCHFASLLDPQIPWWTDCEFKINPNGELTRAWGQMRDLIEEQSNNYRMAQANARHPDDDMSEQYRELRDGMDLHLQKIFNQPNYGRGIPVLVSGWDLSNSTLNLLGARVHQMDLDDVHRHNVMVLQQLEDPELGPERLAGVPAPEPRIVCQTKRRIGVTLIPGPVVTSKDFENVDLVLVDQEVERQHAPEIMLREGTVLSTFRMRGIAQRKRLADQAETATEGSGVPRGTLAGTPTGVETTQVYVEYLLDKAWDRTMLSDIQPDLGTMTISCRQLHICSLHPQSVHLRVKGLIYAKEA
eukprot:4135756-Amphidinium_carterae.4